MVVRKYKLLFQQATGKLIKEPSHEISRVAESIKSG